METKINEFIQQAEKLSQEKLLRSDLYSSFISAPILDEKDVMKKIKSDFNSMDTG